MSGAVLYAGSCVFLYNVVDSVVCAGTVAKRSDGLVSSRGRESDDQRAARFYNGKSRGIGSVLLF